MAHPTPYNYPPWEVLDSSNYDPGFYMPFKCDPGVRHFRRLHTRKDGWFETASGLAWFPEIDININNYCNWAEPFPKPAFWELLHEFVPSSYWVKTRMTITLSSAIQAGDFDPQTGFFSGAVSQFAPFVLSYKSRTSNSELYKRAESAGVDPRNIYWEYYRDNTPQNVVCLWQGLAGLIPQCSDVKQLSVLSPNDTWIFEFDLSRNGILMESGDAIKFVMPVDLISKVTSFYLCHEFATSPLNKDTPYFTAGSKFINIPPPP